MLLLIAGMPASGKTTAMHRLAGELHIPAVSKDALKEILFDTVGFSSRQEKNALGYAAILSAYHMAGNCLAAGQSFAIESNFGASDVRIIEELCHRHNAQPVTLRMDCPVELAYTRFIARDQSPSRHRGHVVNTVYPERGIAPAYQPMTLNEFAQGVTERGIIHFSVGREIVVDTSDFDSIDWKAVARRILNEQI